MLPYRLQCPQMSCKTNIDLRDFKSSKSSCSSAFVISLSIIAQDMWAVVFNHVSLAYIEADCVLLWYTSLTVTTEINQYEYYNVFWRYFLGNSDGIYEFHILICFFKNGLQGILVRLFRNKNYINFPLLFTAIIDLDKKVVHLLYCRQFKWWNGPIPNKHSVYLVRKGARYNYSQWPTGT